LTNILYHDNLGEVTHYFMQGDDPMPNEEAIVVGRTDRWMLRKKLGEGDAGEVFLVKSVTKGHMAVLKRPVRGTATRQAAQIQIEGDILITINDMSVSTSGAMMSPVRCLDQSEAGTENSGRYFIVTEFATGLDLQKLEEIAKRGMDILNVAEFEEEELEFLRFIAEQKKIPRLIILRAMDGLLKLLDRVHTFPGEI